MPSGNFGNICAGHIARMMGLPVAKLILATNENDVLDEFFRTGVYRPARHRRNAHHLVAVDGYSKASNFERFVFDLVGRDGAKVRELWAKVDAGSSFDIRYPVPPNCRSSASSQAARATPAVWPRSALREKYGTMIDTHTADGPEGGAGTAPAVTCWCWCWKRHCRRSSRNHPEALNRAPERPAKLEGHRACRSAWDVMAPEVAAVKQYLVERIPA